MTLEDTLEGKNDAGLESVDNHLAAEGGELHGEIDQTPRQQENLGPNVSRRSVVAAMGAALTGVAGCLTQGSNPEPTETDTPTSTRTDTPTPTEETTTEETTTAVDDKSFEEIYMEEVNEPWEMESGREIKHALNRPEIDKYEDEDRWDSFSDKMTTLKDEILGNWSVINDSQEFTKHLQHAIHNDLDYDASEVRVLGRDGAGGGTYTAIFHKNDDGDWVKDLALPASGDAGYLAHDDTEDDVDFNHEASRGLWNTWDVGTGSNSATSYHAIDEGNNAKDDTWDTLMSWIARGNDHIVVGEPYDEPTVWYTEEAADRLTEIQHFKKNDTFNEEMAVVEEATEAWHNSEEPYLKMEMAGGELTPTPTEEYKGPERLYG